jgi:serine/threonine protein kinase
MVMEFLRGEDLRHAIREGHLGDLQAKLRIALQVARALGYIHSLGIVHRDIKPENIHLTTSGAVKLMDFGIAKTQGLSMTRTGCVMGTPFYMAPEQVLGKNIGPAVDIYAFGALFFELLTGVQAVTGETIERIFYAILNEPLDLAAAQGQCAAAGLRFDRALYGEGSRRKASQLRCRGGRDRADTDWHGGRPRGSQLSSRSRWRRPPPPRPVIAKPTAKGWMAVALGIALLIAIAVLVKVLLAPAPGPKQPHRSPRRCNFP